MNETNKTITTKLDSNSYLRQLSNESAQETCLIDGGIEARLEDLVLIEEPGYSLLVGTSRSEIEAWFQKFGRYPVGLSLDNQWNDPLIIKGDMHDMQWGIPFDFVYASQVLEHSPFPMLALKRIRDSLKKDGKFFFWIPFDIGNQTQKYHYSCFPKEIWVDLMNKADLIVVETIIRGNSIGYKGYAL